jgi:hypothetical protein
MRVKIKPAEGKITFRLWFPTSALKSKFVTKIMVKYCKGVNIDFSKLMPLLYKSLKSHIKHNGHFVLIDVVSSDGDKVVVRV